MDDHQSTGRLAEVDQDVASQPDIDAIYAVCQQHLRPGFWIGDAIPDKKLRNAQDHFPIPRDVAVIGLVDGTVFGSNKNGLAVTAEGIVWQNGTSRGCTQGTLSWEQLAVIPFISKQGNYVELGTEFDVNVAGSSYKDTLAVLLLDLRCLARHEPEPRTGADMQARIAHEAAVRSGVLESAQRARDTENERQEAAKREREQQERDAKRRQRQAEQQAAREPQERELAALRAQQEHERALEQQRRQAERRAAQEERDRQQAAKRTGQERERAAALERREAEKVARQEQREREKQQREAACQVEQQGREEEERQRHMAVVEDHAVSEGVYRLVQVDDKIAAIKLLRAEQGIGVHEAKKIVDAIAATGASVEPALARTAGQPPVPAQHVPQDEPWARNVGMLQKWEDRKEIKALRKLSAQGELVEQVIAGRYGDHNGVLAATDRRLIFLDKGWGSTWQRDFSYDKISSIEFESGWGHGSLTLFAAGAAERIEHVYKEQLQPFAEFVRRKINEPTAPQRAAAPERDVAASLAQLADFKAQGILSDDEFQQAKAKLLR